jgi:hypothetical protein
MYIQTGIHVYTVYMYYMSESDNRYCLNCFHWGCEQPWFTFHFNKQLLLSALGGSRFLNPGKPQLLSCWGPMGYGPTIVSPTV